MAKLNVPITKSAYLGLKRDLSFAEEGFSLLDQKREILVLELMRLVQRAKVVQQQVEEKMAAAFGALQEAVVESASFSVRSQAVFTDYEHEIEVTQHRLMGISIPTARGTHERFGTKFGLASSSAKIDTAMERFLDALKSIDELAQVQTSVWRLAREVKKTQRRVNALEKIFIPDYKETLTYVLSTLEERERESFHIMKMVKERLAAGRTKGP